MSLVTRPGRPAAGTRHGFAVARVRRGVVVFWGAVVLAAGVVLVARFRIDNSVSIWFATDDPALADYRQSLSDFGAAEWALVALEWAAAGSAGRATGELARAAALERFAARLRQVPEVHAVLSAAELPPDAPLVRRFLRPDSAAGMEGLLVRVTNDLGRQDDYRERLIDDIRAAGADLPARAVRVAGIAVINGELNRSARRDMWVFFPAVALLLALVGALMFRNVRDTAVLLAVALATVVTTMGLLVGFGYPLNMVTIMLPTVLIALSVADVVHLIHVFHSARDAGVGAGRAAGLAARRIAKPCLATTLTTMAGLVAFAGSSVLPVYQLAIFGATGVGLAWVLTLTLGAALLGSLWHGRDRPARAGAIGECALGRLWRLVGRHPGRTAAAFLAGGITLLGLGRLEADTDYVRFFRAGSRVPEDYRALERAGFPQNPLSLVIDLPASHAAMARHGPDVVTFTRRLEDLRGVRAVLSPLTLAGPTTSGSASLAAAFPAAPFRELGMLSEGEDRVQLTVMMDYPSSRRLVATLAEIRRLQRAVLPPELGVTATGTSVLWAHMDEGVIRTQRQSLAIVSVVCFVILVALFRSVLLGLIGLLLSAYPVAMILGIMGLLGITLNMATVLIAGIAVGIAVDDTIHFVHAWQAGRARGADRWVACGRAMAEVGVRMVTTSAILVGSFAVMGVSSFMPTAQFGLLTSATIALALAADLMLLPVILTGGGTAPTAIPASPLAPARERSA